MSITVTVKWGKQKFENVELDTSAPVELFKAQLYALTSVPPERQKIMGVKGGTVKARRACSPQRGSVPGALHTRARRAALRSGRCAAGGPDSRAPGCVVRTMPAGRRWE
jgi:hypothetical protein